MKKTTANTTANASRKATTMAKSSKRVARENQAQERPTKATSNPEPATAPNDDAIAFGVKIIEAIAHQVATDEGSRQNFNLILAKASNGKLQVMEVDAPKGKSRARAKA